MAKFKKNGPGCCSCDYGYPSCSGDCDLSAVSTLTFSGIMNIISNPPSAIPSMTLNRIITSGSISVGAMVFRSGFYHLPNFFPAAQYSYFPTGVTSDPPADYLYVGLICSSSGWQLVLFFSRTPVYTIGGQQILKTSTVTRGCSPFMISGDFIEGTGAVNKFMHSGVLSL